MLVRIRLLLLPAIPLLSLLVGCQTTRMEPSAKPIVAFLFPEVIGGMEKGERVDYEETYPGMGYSVAYGHSQSRLDIYIYDLGQPEIPNGIYADAASFAFSHGVYEIEEAAREGIYQTLEYLSRGNTTIGNLGFMGREFRYRQEDTYFRTYLWVSALHNKLVKIRLTLPDFGEDAMTVLEAIHRSLNQEFIQPNLETIEGNRHLFIIIEEDGILQVGNTTYPVMQAYYRRIAEMAQEVYTLDHLPYGLLHRSFQMEYAAMEAAIETALKLESHGNRMDPFWKQLAALREAGHLPAYAYQYRNVNPAPPDRLSPAAIEACIQWVNTHMEEAHHDWFDLFGVVLVIPKGEIPM